MKPGDLVRMSEKLKATLRQNDSIEHVKEFGECTGVVEGPAFCNCPELNVRWKPSGLRYAYHPDLLVKLG
jgi:hypothetical protein